MARVGAKGVTRFTVEALEAALGGDVRGVPRAVPATPASPRASGPAAGKVVPGWARGLPVGRPVRSAPIPKKEGEKWG